MYWYRVHCGGLLLWCTRQFVQDEVPAMLSIQTNSTTRKLVMFVALNAQYSIGVLIAFVFTVKLGIVRSSILLVALRLLPICYHNTAAVSSLIMFINVYSFFALLSIVSLERFYNPLGDASGGTYVRMFRQYQIAKLPGLILVPLYTLRCAMPVLTYKFFVLLLGYAALLAYFPGTLKNWLIPTAVAVILVANIPEMVRVRLSDGESQNTFDMLFDPVANLIGVRLAGIIPRPPEGTVWDNKRR